MFRQVSFSRVRKYLGPFELCSSASSSSPSSSGDFSRHAGDPSRDLGRDIGRGSSLCCRSFAFFCTAPAPSICCRGDFARGLGSGDFARDLGSGDFSRDLGADSSLCRGTDPGMVRGVRSWVRRARYTLSSSRFAPFTLTELASGSGSLPCGHSCTTEQRYSHSSARDTGIWGSRCSSSTLHSVPFHEALCFPRLFTRTIEPSGKPYAAAYSVFVVASSGPWASA
mmetsp:Transcript_17290/g.41661  ORF Transcript_17290/g.41661 Transcript_17290/m.41661 type:complete len:225 (+) Transcript_17290:468-1142(+)